MCWMTPGPSIDARVVVSPAGSTMLGETFHPAPSSRAKAAPLPSVAAPPLPFSPVKFSGLMLRVLACDNRARPPRPNPVPTTASTRNPRSYDDGMSTVTEDLSPLKGARANRRPGTGSRQTDRMPRPNLLLFMPDELRADAVGAFGNPVVQTPNIDALAARGTKWTDAYAQHSVCGPSRVSLFTGWYPHVAGHRTLTNLLKPWEPNLLKLLRDSGYNVAWVGQRGDTFAPGVTELSTDFAGWKVAPKLLYQRSPFPPEHKMARAFYW